MIYVVVNSRAERGPLESVIAALPEARVIGFNVDATLPPAREMATALHWFTDKLKDASVVVVLGDRFETLAAALAAMFLRKRVCHIHGGETTTGAFDDALRHGITHIAETTGGVHCLATDLAGARVMGLLGRRNNALDYTMMQRDNIHLVGAPGLDGIEQNSAKRDKKLIVASYYAETMAADSGVAGCRAMLDALAPYAADDYALFFSSVNTDPGSAEIGAMIQDFIFSNPASALWIAPDTREQYLHLMQHAQLVVGNSSAGVIEAPWIGCPSVNIGYRQQGREMAGSVFQYPADGGEEMPEIIAAAMAWRGPCEPTYRGVGVGAKIAEIVRGLVA